jgi:hypothetical protein
MTDEQNIPKAIAKAILQTEEQAKREHIKADRFERAGLFVVNLRRELIVLGLSPHNRNSYVAALCEKKIWYDAGILNKEGTWYGSGVSSHMIQSFVTTARDLVPMQSIDFEGEIKRDLVELDRSLVVAKTLAQEAERVNSKADNLLNSLCALAESA